MPRGLNHGDELIETEGPRRPGMDDAEDGRQEIAGRITLRTPAEQARAAACRCVNSPARCRCRRCARAKLSCGSSARRCVITG